MLMGRDKGDPFGTDRNFDPVPLPLQCQLLNYFLIARCIPCSCDNISLERLGHFEDVSGYGLVRYSSSVVDLCLAKVQVDALGK